MNPDKEDPNNHAPAVTPDDDWNGLDVDQVFDSQLPPRRSDAPKTPKMDVNLSRFKAIKPGSHSGISTSSHDEAHSKSQVSMKVNGERLVSEKEEFQATLVMESVQQGDEPSHSNQMSAKPGRFIPGERDDWGVSRHKGSSRWMLYTAAGVIGLIALTVFLSRFMGEETVRKSDKRSLSQLEPIDVKTESIRDLGVAGQLANNHQEAVQIYGQYAQAKSPDDFSKFIYLSDRNTPLLKEAWKATGAESGWMPSGSSSWKTYRDGELIYAELRGVNHDFSKFIACFRYENSDLKMDWKATTGYGTAAFDDLKIGKGEGSEIRGWIATSDFFTQQLSDDKYHSFIVRSPKKDASIWVYTEIGSEVDKDILALFSTSPITGEFQTEAKVILNLDRGAEEILPRQWMIKGLIAANWLDQATP
ncbi:MAG: hypothetical protein V4727_07740 [Verrucomicrobiota bacterium]